MPYALVGYLLALVLLLAVRRGTERSQRGWVTGGAALAVAGLGLHGALLAPAFVGGHAHGPPDLTVMTLNLRHGGADAGRVLRLVRSRDVDVLVLEEVTPSARERLRAAGLDRRLPLVAGSPHAGDSGTMVFSGYPLTGAAPLAVRHGGWQVRVHAPQPFVLFAVHTSQPLDNAVPWRKDWRAIQHAVADSSGPRMVVGDFNATLDHGPVRDLLGLGLRDAARESNAGWQPTWPAWLPLIAVDHVLVTAPFGVISARTATVTGTDHRALVTEVRW